MSPNCSSHSSCPRAGFSLPELLIVLGVIIVICMLLIPLVKGGAERSYAAKCMGNLRNFGVAHTAFMADKGYVTPYKHWIPSDVPGGAATGGRVWYGIIAEYGVGEALAAHTCLAAKRRYARMASGGLYGTPNYGWSANIPTDTTALMRTVSVQKPGSLFLAADSTVTPTVASWLIQISQTDAAIRDQERTNNFSFRHNGKANVLFMDGHIEALGPSDIPLRTVPRTPEFERFWNANLIP